MTTLVKCPDCRDGLRGRKPGERFICPTCDGLGKFADRRAPSADARTVERDALLQIQQWCEAYPATVFLEPDYDKARAALEAAGMTMDGLHGSWARHLLTGIGDIARAALAAAAAEGE